MKWDKAFPEVPEVFHNRIVDTLNSQDDYAMERMKSMRITKKMIIIAAAAILICSLSLGAYALIMWNPKFAELFNADDTQQQNLIEDSTTVMLGQAAVDNGVTIEAVQMIGDKNTVYILFRVTGTKAIIENEISFGYLEVTIGELSSMYDGFIYMGTTSADDNETQEAEDQQYIALRIVDERLGDLMGETITVKISELGMVEDGIVTDTILGDWELSWAMNIEDHTESLTVNEPLEFDGNTAMIESFELSSVSLTVNLGGDGIYGFIEAMDETNENPLMVRFSIMMKDGSIFEGVDFPGIEGWNENVEGSYSIYRCLSSILDIEKIASISLTFSNGITSKVVKIPVEQ